MKRNKYEFNIEDINTAKVSTIPDEHNYAVIYTRKFINEKPTTDFIMTYEADEDDDMNGSIGVLCPRCGIWSYYDATDTEKIQEKHCERCTKDFEEIISEDELISILLSYMNQETFLDISLTINNKYII